MGRLALARGKGPPVSTDTTPNAFSFTDVSGKTESTTVTGSPVTITGINASTSFSVTGGSVQINGAGSFVTSGSVVNNDTLTPQGTASASYLGTTDVVVTVGGVSDTFTITTRSDPGVMPTLAPSASWDGTLTWSGRTPPTDPTRTTAKPRVVWWQDSLEAFSGETVLGVYADCEGGLDGGVTVWAEGGTVNIPSPSLYTDTINGMSRTRFGYWFKVNSGDWTGQAAAGRARFYASAVPVDGSMQTRVIGTDAMLPLELYPRAAANDGAYSVRADGAGGAYTTIKNALAAAEAAGKKTPIVTINQNGTYELENCTHTAVTDNKGRCVITVGAGVTATLSRASMPTTIDNASWTWDPRWDCIEFRGAGLTVDDRNFAFIKASAEGRGALFSCVVTNSIGTRDTLYRFRAPHPGISGIDGGGSSVKVGFVGCPEISYQYGGSYSFAFRDSNVYKCIGGNRDAIKFPANLYEAEVDCRFYTALITAFTLTRAAGGATCDVTSGRNLVLKVGGVTKATYALSFDPTATWYKTEDIVADINANTSGGVGHGIVAVSLDTTRASGSIFPNTTDPNGVGATLSLTSTATNITTQFDIHSEYYHTYVGMGEPLENNVLLNINLRKCYYSSSVLNLQAAKDLSLVNFLGPDYDDSVFAGYFGNSTAAGVMSHTSFTNVAVNGLLMYTAYPHDSYCRFRQVSIGYLAQDTAASAGVWPTSPIFTDCMVFSAPSGPVASVTPNGAGSGGNTGLASYAAWTGLFADSATGDYRPSSTALANLKTSAIPYDGTGTARSASDVILPWSKNAALPTRPF